MCGGGCYGGAVGGVFGVVGLILLVQVVFDLSS